jgi:hypothetical protein
LQEATSDGIDKNFSVNLEAFRTRNHLYKGNLSSVPYTNLGKFYQITDLIEMFRIKYIESKKHFLQWGSP